MNAGWRFRLGGVGVAALAGCALSILVAPQALPDGVALERVRRGPRQEDKRAQVIAVTRKNRHAGAIIRLKSYD